MVETKSKELSLLKQHQIEKYNILIVLQSELNAINEEQKYHEKLRSKYLFAAQNKAKEEKDFEKLQDISKHQKEQIKKITKEIQTLRLKIKPKHQFLLNERSVQERTSPQVFTLSGYMVDACEDSARSQSVNSFTSSATGHSSNVSNRSVASKTSDAIQNTNKIVNE